MTGFEIAAIVMMIVAAAGTAAMQVQQGKAQKKAAQMQADYQRAQADAEAKQAEREAEWADYRIEVNRQQAEVKKRETRQKALEDMARSRVSRIGISSGSGTLLAEEIESINQLGYTLDLMDWETQIEADNIRKEKGSYNYQAALAENQGLWASEMGQFTGSQAVSSSRFAAGGSLLAGGAQAASAYSSSQNNKQLISALRG